MKNLYFLAVAFLLLQVARAQEGVPFSPNKQLYIQGNSILIGNNIMGHHPTEALTDITLPNDIVKMEYIDVDDDENTFSSSQATINNQTDNPKIVYAALYWSGLYPYQKGVLRQFGKKMEHRGKGEREGAVNSILFKTPGGNYQTINGQVVFDSYQKEVFTTNTPYTCYAEVTSILQNLSTINGTYTVANVKATVGEISGGSSAGWLLYVVYEDPAETPKYFTTYNGLVEVNKAAVEIDFSNFKSKEAGGIKTTLAFGTLEGDRKLKTDHIAIFNTKTQHYKTLSNELRAEKNFFNSSITYNDEVFTARNPSSTNTLGFDLLKIDVPNADNQLINSNTQEVKLKFQTKADRFYLFFVAFETEINQTFFKAKQLGNEQEGLAVTTSEIPKPETIAAAVLDSTAINTETGKTLIASSEDDSSETKKEAVEVKEPKKETQVTTKTTAVSKPKKPIKKKEIYTEEEAAIRKQVRFKSLKVAGMGSGYYLITNVFSVPENAAKWSQFLVDKNHNPKTFITPWNNWNYVYVYHNENLSRVFDKWKALREHEYFEEIWIVKMNL